MELIHLILRSFRSYKEQAFDFAPQTNYIQGANGSGKSSLLEAIRVLSTGKSFRSHKLQDLIHHQDPHFSLYARFQTIQISHSLHVEFGKEGRKARHNETEYSSFLPLLSVLPSVILSPEDISIIDGSPAERRKFLDIHLAQADPLYVHHLGRYQKAWKERNALLRNKKSKGLSIFDELLSISAAYILEKRIQALQSLTPLLQFYVQELSQAKEQITVSYKSSFSLEDLTPSYLQKQLEDHHSQDQEQGTTLLGPHRDDLLFFLQGKDLKTYGSEGQKRCCLAALRCSEWEQLHKHFEKKPLFGVDDFSAHLDAQRSESLFQILQNMGQIFLTAPQFPSFITPYKSSHTTINVCNMPVPQGNYLSIS